MNAIVEDLSIAEVLAYRNDTVNPLWNDLMNDYDADVVDDIGTGWPPVMDTVGEVPDADEPKTDEDAPAEDKPFDEDPAQDPDTKPVEAEPAAE